MGHFQAREHPQTMSILIGLVQGEFSFSYHCITIHYQKFALLLRGDNMKASSYDLI